MNFNVYLSSGLGSGFGDGLGSGFGDGLGVGQVGGGPSNFRNSAKLYIMADLIDPQMVARMQGIRQALGLPPYDQVSDTFHFTLLDFDINLASKDIGAILKNGGQDLIKVVGAAYMKHIDGVGMMEMDFKQMSNFLTTSFWMYDVQSGQTYKPHVDNHPIRSFRREIMDYIQSQVPGQRLLTDIMDPASKRYVLGDLYSIPDYYFRDEIKMHVSFANKFEPGFDINRIQLKGTGAKRSLRYKANAVAFLDRDNPNKITLNQQSIRLSVTLASHPKSLQGYANVLPNLGLQPLPVMGLKMIPERLRTIFSYFIAQYVPIGHIAPPATGNAGQQQHQQQQQKKRVQDTTKQKKPVQDTRGTTDQETATGVCGQDPRGTGRYLGVLLDQDAPGLLQGIVSRPGGGNVRENPHVTLIYSGPNVDLNKWQTVCQRIGEIVTVTLDAYKVNPRLMMGRVKMGGGLDQYVATGMPHITLKLASGVQGKESGTVYADRTHRWTYVNPPIELRGQIQLLGPGMPTNPLPAVAVQMEQQQTQKEKTTSAPESGMSLVRRHQFAVQAALAGETNLKQFYQDSGSAFGSSKSGSSSVGSSGVESAPARHAATSAPAGVGVAFPQDPILVNPGSGKRCARSSTKHYWDRYKIRKYNGQGGPGIPKILFVFGENDAAKGTGKRQESTQANIRGEPNAIGLRTVWYRGEWGPDYAGSMRDSTFQKNIQAITQDVHEIYEEFVDGKYDFLVLPGSGLGTGVAALNTQAPLTYEFLKYAVYWLCSSVDAGKALAFNPPV